MALRNQYLREMGIDVWVLRSERPHHSMPTAGSLIESAAPVAAGKQSAPTGPQMPNPEFHLCFMTWQEVSLVFSLGRDSRGSAEGLRRFAEDVGLAMGSKAAPVINAVQWPMVQSRHIDQSEQAARAALKQRIDLCARMIVVFGEEAANWIDGSGARQVIQARDMSTYVAKPLAKRELWETLMKAMSGALL